MVTRKDDAPQTVTTFQHENALMHYGLVNKRSMIMLICVCVTFVVVTATYVIGGIIRDKNRDQYWLEVIKNLTPTATEVQADGLHQQPNP